MKTGAVRIAHVSFAEAVQLLTFLGLLPCSIRDVSTIDGLLCKLHGLIRVYLEGDQSNVRK